MKSLRSGLVRLAHTHPEFRDALLPLLREKQAARLPLGRTVMTRGVSGAIQRNPEMAGFVQQSLQRHARGDWGDVDRQDGRANDEALEIGERILSSYSLSGTKIWIVTERDRSVTTVLFPSEY